MANPTTKLFLLLLTSFFLSCTKSKQKFDVRDSNISLELVENNSLTAKITVNSENLLLPEEGVETELVCRVIKECYTLEEGTGILEFTSADTNEISLGTIEENLMLHVDTIDLIATMGVEYYSLYLIGKQTNVEIVYDTLKWTSPSGVSATGFGYEPSFQYEYVYDKYRSLSLGENVVFVAENFASPVLRKFNLQSGQEEVFKTSFESSRLTLLCDNDQHAIYAHRERGDADDHHFLHLVKSDPPEIKIISDLGFQYSVEVWDENNQVSNAAVIHDGKAYVELEHAGERSIFVYDLNSQDLSVQQFYLPSNTSWTWNLLHGKFHGTVNAYGKNFALVTDGMQDEAGNYKLYEFAPSSMQWVKVAEFNGDAYQITAYKDQLFLFSKSTRILSKISESDYSLTEIGETGLILTGFVTQRKNQSLLHGLTAGFQDNKLRPVNHE